MKAGLALSWLLKVALQNATFPSKIRVKYTVFGLKRARSGESLGQ